MALKDKFEEGWWNKLSPFLCSPAFIRTGNYIKELATKRAVTPLFDDTFRAFKECPYNKLKVVILGLDPYPQEKVADGLAFSARNNLLNPPKSLVHIIDAIEREVYGGFAIGYNENYAYPDLTRWANQGVLLLNQALTTYVGETGAHLDLWAPFIRNVFKVLRENNTGLIYILLGSKAKQWKVAIDGKNNYILTASHPASAAYSGRKYWDSEGIFLTTNELLEQHNGPEAKILW
jgi:uracil-DNA glycosylase